MKQNAVLSLFICLILAAGLTSGCQGMLPAVEAPPAAAGTETAGTAPVEQAPAAPAPAAPDDGFKVFAPIARTSPGGIIREMLAQVSQERAITHLRRLTGEDPICLKGTCYTIINRQTGSLGLKWARDYIAAELAGLGYAVERQDWQLSGYADQNLVVRIPGQVTPGEEINFVAHADGVDSPAADDDASGVVDLLELARVAQNRAFSRTLVLLFTTGEEHGALGARGYLNQLSNEELGRIRYVVTTEMLSYDSNNDGDMQLWSGEQPLDFTQALSGIIREYEPRLVTQIVPGCA